MSRLLGLLLLIAAFSVHAAGNTESDVDKLLTMTEPPAGVVFELVSGDPDAWDWAAPLLQSMRDKIRQRFPDLDIALVSHGSEQFFLTRDRQHEKPKAITALSGLSDAGVDVHVCAVHSGWRNVSTDDYLSFVDVAASGPAQVNDYVKLGFKLIHLKNPNED